LTVENAGDIAAICTRLEGVPLAIELAAEQSNVLPPKSLLAQLERPLEVLIGRRRDASERHMSLLKTLSWNDDLLTLDEQTLFRRLAVFVGGCSLHAIEAISTALGGMTSPILDSVLSLVDKSLLRFSVSCGDEPRLSLQELIRAYALKRLIECGELAQVRAAHAAYYLEFAENATTLAEANQAVTGGLEWDVENMRIALEWLLERKNGEEALRLGVSLDALPERRMVIPLRTKEPLFPPAYDELTAREIEVLRLLATGLSNKRIAEYLVLSPHTVNVHIHSIFSKLAVHSRSAATRYALDHQIA
jgi:predicted ATPase/DNA-binding CsgD family transcriptional regulator